MPRRVALMVAIVAGCFSPDGTRGTAPATLGTTDASTTTGGCPEGSLGCPCYGNGTCDEGLECGMGADVCVMPGCTPGQLGCACVDGVCLEGLDCAEGTCQQPSTTSGTGTSGDASTSGCLDDPFCTACQDCVTMAVGPGGDCEDVMCEADPECVSRVQCCAEYIGMCPGCCRETTVDDAFWSQMAACVESLCPDCSFSCN